MINITCTCDRCGKEFPKKDSKTIIFKKADAERKNGLKIENDAITGRLLKDLKKFLTGRLIRDYCPDCIAEFKEFLNMKGENDSENSFNQY